MTAWIREKEKPYCWEAFMSYIFPTPRVAHMGNMDSVPSTVVSLCMDGFRNKNTWNIYALNSYWYSLENSFKNVCVSVCVSVCFLPLPLSIAERT